jgi:branched-chain amino acid transport system substrate-binding protein
VAVSATALIMLFAACGSDKKTEAGSTDGTVAPSPTKAAINVGVIATMTGPLSSTGVQGGNVALAWEKWINAKGGIDGHPVKVFVEDDGADPTKGLAAAKKLVDSDNVVAVIAGTDIVLPAWDDYVIGKGIPIIGGAPNSPDWAKKAGLFNGATDILSHTLVVDVAVKYGKSKGFANLYCQEIAACQLSDPPLKVMSQKLGLKHQALAIGAAAPDYTAECLKMKQEGTDYPQLNVVAATAVRVIQNCQAQGYNPTWGTSLQAYGSEFKALTSNFKAYGPSYAFNPKSSNPASKDFNEAMSKYAGSAEYEAGSGPFAWDGIQILTAALGKVQMGEQAPTPAQLLEGLYALNGSDVGGEFANPLTFVKGQPPLANGGRPCAFIMGAENGKLTAPAGNDKVCATK